MFSVQGLVVVITGGNQNIGAEVAKRFAQDGAKLALCDVTEETSLDIRRWLDEGNYPYLWEKVDISKKDQVDAFMELVKERFDRIDVLFNNAAVRVGEAALEHSEDKWDWLFDINVKGTMLCCQAAALIMKEQGGGKIINTSSISAFRGQDQRSSYCASKAAVTGYTLCSAMEWAQYGIYVNAVAWGGVNVEEIPYEQMSAGMKKTADMTPLPKLLNGDRLYGPVAFLASAASEGITGQTILVDGGWSITGKPRR